jgi:hypothetical protein
MKIRALSAAMVCAATLLVGAAAGPARAMQPPPEPAPAQATCDLGATIARLMDEERHATTLAERRLIHHEHILVMLDREC